LEEYEKEYFQDFSISASLQDLEVEKWTGQDIFQLFLQIGKESQKKVKKFSNYIRLIYVDVVEFQGVHIQKNFNTMRDRYRSYFGPFLKELQEKGVIRKDINPLLGIMSLSMAYFNFFTVEHVFGAKRHFGVAPSQGIEEIASIYAHGFLSSNQNSTKSKKKKSKKEAYNKKHKSRTV
ncbi:MAG: hypothetical protein D6785_15705, partial [Planctomycetota bacterium]